MAGLAIEIVRTYVKLLVVHLSDRVEFSEFFVGSTDRLPLVPTCCPSLYVF